MEEGHLEGRSIYCFALLKTLVRQNDHRRLVTLLCASNRVIRVHLNTLCRQGLLNQAFLDELDVLAFRACPTNFFPRKRQSPN